MYHELCLFMSHVTGAGSLRSGCQQGLVLARAISGLQMTGFSLYPHLVEGREKQAPQDSYKDTNPIREGSRLVTSAACMLSCFSHVRFWATLWTEDPPGSSVQGILQARVLERVAMSSSRGSSRPRDWTSSLVSSIGRRVLYHYCHLGSPRVRYGGNHLLVCQVNTVYTLNSRNVMSIISQ